MALVVAFATGYVGMQRLGVLGAPLGVLAGELIGLAGVVVLSLRQLGAHRSPGADATEIVT